MSLRVIKAEESHPPRHLSPLRSHQPYRATRLAQRRAVIMLRFWKVRSRSENLRTIGCSCKITMHLDGLAWSGECLAAISWMHLIG